jgi:hypothetical protein
LSFRYAGAGGGTQHPSFPGWSLRWGGSICAVTGEQSPEFGNPGVDAALLYFVAFNGSGDKVWR